MRPLIVRSAGPARAALSLLATSLLFACGGSDAPTGVDENPNPPGGQQPPPEPPPPLGLVLGSDSAHSYEFITLRPGSGAGTLPDSVTGTIGDEELFAVRADDSTLVAFVPEGVSGKQPVRFEIGAKKFESELTVVAPPSVGDPVAGVLEVFDQVNARLDSLEAAISDGAIAAEDADGLTAFVASARDVMAASRSDFLALTAEEQAAAAPYILVDAATYGFEAGGDAPSARMVADPWRSGPSMATDASPLCTGEGAFEDCLLGRSRATQRSDTALGVLQRCHRSMLKGGLFGFVAGGLGGLLADRLTGRAAAAGMEYGALTGAMIGLVWCKYDLATAVSAMLQEMVEGELADVLPNFARGTTVPGLSPLVGRPAPGAPLMAEGSEEGETYTVGVPAEVSVYANFSSLSAESAGGPPAVKNLYTQFQLLINLWDVIRSEVTFVNLPAISLPAAPRRTVRKKVPGEYLSVRSIAPSPIQGTGMGSDPWMVTFTNPNQGDDHDFTFRVRLSLPDHDDQEKGLQGMLRPAKYTVASLELSPAQDTISVDGTTSFTWVASDSTGDVLTDSLLLGRKPTWTSSSTTVATVGSSSGTVTGKSDGSATVTARLEEGEATVTVVVLPDFYGTYSLIEVNGISIPGTTYEDSLYIIETSGGSVTLNMDGTFSYSLSSTGINKVGGESFDEGGSGSGTYTHTGGVLTFNVEEQEGPMTIASGSVNGKQLTVSVNYGDTVGSGVLVRN